MDLEKKILSDITVHMKYARYIEDEQRRENWDELVTRNMNMHIKKFPSLEQEIRENYKFVYNKQVYHLCEQCSSEESQSRFLQTASLIALTHQQMTPECSERSCSCFLAELALAIQFSTTLKNCQRFIDHLQREHVVFLLETLSKDGLIQ